jgi:hypothetical protein
MAQGPPPQLLLECAAGYASMQHQLPQLVQHLLPQLMQHQLPQLVQHQLPQLVPHQLPQACSTYCHSRCSIDCHWRAAPAATAGAALQHKTFCCCINAASSHHLKLYHNYEHFTTRRYRATHFYCKIHLYRTTYYYVLRLF